MQTLPDDYKLAVIQSAVLQAGDVIALMTDRSVSADQEVRLTEYARRVFPDHVCIVLSDGLKLGIINRGDPDADEHCGNEAATPATNQDLIRAFGLAGMRVKDFNLRCTPGELPMVTLTRFATAAELETVRFELHNPKPTQDSVPAAVDDDERMTWQEAIECTASLHRGTVARWFRRIDDDLNLAFQDHETIVLSELRRLDEVQARITWSGWHPEVDYVGRPRTIEPSRPLTRR